MQNDYPEMIIRIESHGKIHYVGGMDLFGGWVEADMPREMDLRFPDEIAAGQPVNLATKFTVGENANFLASSPILGFLNFLLCLKKLS